MCKLHDCVKDASIFSSYACISQSKETAKLSVKAACYFLIVPFPPLPHPNTHHIFHSSVLTSLNAFIVEECNS